MKKILGFVVLIALFGYSQTAHAALFIGGNSYTLTERNVVSENIYVGATNIVVAGTVDGDAHLAGGTVLVSGNVTQDLSIAGGSVNILGNVGEDVRALGGNIVIESNVGGDLILTGGSVVIAPGITVAGDVVIAGGELLLNGEVQRDLIVAGGTVTINGVVNGNTRAFTDERFEVGDGAVLRGDLTYRSRVDVEVHEGARIVGDIVRENALGENVGESSGANVIGFFGSLTLFKIVGFFILAMLAIYVSRRQSEALVQAATESFWKPLAVGVSVAIATLVVAVLLMVTIIGIPIGVMLIAVYAILMTLGCIFAGPVFGVLIRRVIRKNDSVALGWRVVLIGIVGLVIVSLIPFIGWAIGLIIYALTVGAASIRFHHGVWAKR